MNKYLVIGLGSMGKRRVRCLMELGIAPSDIYGYDNRVDRCEEAKKKYGIVTNLGLEEINFDEIKGIIVSLPPDKHEIGVAIAQRYHKPCFIEASVVIEDVLKIKNNNPEDVFLAPSCTFIFHPMVKEIKKIVLSGKYGRVCNFSYHSGQYLPDWHPWESVNDFYVGNRITGGAREIVPYELTWLVDILGFPMDAKGYFHKTMELGCDIEDTYSCSLLFDNGIVGNLIVDVVSRFATRNLVINMEKGQIQWRCDKEQVEVYDAQTGAWTYVNQEKQKHEKGYNTNIGENMYIEEIKSFIEGIEDPSLYPNTIEKDIKVLEVLDMIEKSDGGF